VMTAPGGLGDIRKPVAGAPPGSGEEPESADAVEVERADPEVGPTVCFHKSTPRDVFLAGFNQRDFAFGFGSFPVAVQELWRPPCCSRWRVALREG
jgi:hypothetical protein